MTSMSRFADILQRYAAGHVGFPGVELLYTSHPRWPLLSKGHEGERDCPHSLTVSVLDSSFNPPTKAHLELSLIPPPVSSIGKSPAHRDYDARLLLYSVKNADKVPRPGDAAHRQRLEMMVLLAGELERAHGDKGASNVAVAVCQEPTFVGKSAVLRFFLQERLTALLTSNSEPTVQLQLVFLLGTDTLERLFAPRYYGSDSAMKAALRTFLSPSGDSSRVICARRSTGASYSQTSLGLPDAAAEFIQSGSVVLVDIGGSERSLSSSEVRDNICNSVEGWERKVPSSVAQYIGENHLYQVPKDDGEVKFK